LGIDLNGIISQHRHEKTVPRRIDLRLKPDMGSFMQFMRIFDHVFPKIVSIGEPEVAEYDQGRISGAGVDKMDVEVVRELDRGGVMKDQLPGIIRAKRG